ncbi:DNA helicase RecQ [Oleidesulfovibrio alaskensis]|uniref:DNA helicase RecQ n=1 Tax=Oleidesulfovibrio alaskensis TaxID=58180 RepID=UPI00040ABEB0|nr:DNA helicase RecQ [Oleidesulfovibrio alaskensis]
MTQQTHTTTASSMLDTAREILISTYGFRDFQGLQKDIIEHTASGGDALVLMPTGGGKSLCYQIPSIMRQGTGIVISPLIALMQDQVDSLTQMGVSAAFLNSSLSPEKQREVEARLLSGMLDLVYVAPERLVQPAFLGLLERITPALFAIDEAHCVSQWGHDFRPEYTRLTILHEQFPHVPRIALTATADGPTRRDIIRHLDLQDATVFSTGFDRPNISYTIQPKDKPLEQLLHFIRTRHKGQSGIVYRLSRKKVEETAAWLCAKGIEALPYHAGLNAIQRHHNQERFMREDGLVMVATVAFGMGVDKPDVRFVAHLEPPKSLEAYHQETGRAGRDGLPADAWMTYGLADVVQLRRMLGQGEEDSPRRMVELRKLDAMLAFCETTECRRKVLLGYFGEHDREPCGNCDTCQFPVETWDGTVAAQKALSAVYRTGQRFGAAHLTDILTGKLTDRIRSHGHNDLKTFGCGKELGASQWKGVFRQLACLGLLATDADGHGGLRLTPESWQVLRGERMLSFRRDILGRSATRALAKTQADAALQNALNTEESRQLWDTLRSLRGRLAQERDVPPYAVFADRALLEMVCFRPRTPDDLQCIHGVGKAKLSMFGQEFLDALLSHEAAWGRPDDLPALPERRPATAAKKENGLTDTIRETLQLFNKLQDMQAVAEARALKPATICNHLVRCIRHGELTTEQVVPLPAHELAEIRGVLGETASLGGVTAAHGRLKGRYDFETLRLVQAELFIRRGDEEDW